MPYGSDPIVTEAGSGYGKDQPQGSQQGSQQSKNVPIDTSQQPDPGAALLHGMIGVPVEAGRLLNEYGAKPLGWDLTNLVPSAMQRGWDVLSQRAQKGGGTKIGEGVGSTLPFVFGGAGPTVARGIGRGAATLWDIFRTGTLPAALQPTTGKIDPKEKAEQAGIGTLFGMAGSLPGAAARALGYRDVPALFRAMESRSPEFVQKTFDAFRQLSMPTFNRAWYDHVLEPLGLKRPEEVGHAGLAALDDMIGKELDSATKTMWLDARPGTPVIPALNTTMGIARRNILDEGAWKAYQSTIRDLVVGPLQRSGGRLGSGDLQAVTSNLQAAIRGIRPTSEAQRTLRFELEQFRMRLLDNASGGDPARYRAARNAWSRFVIGREATPPTQQMFTPAGVLTQMDRRNPYQVPLGRAPGQDVAQAGHEALLLPGRAAQRAQQGLPPRQPSLFTASPSLSAVAGQTVDQRRRPSVYQENQ